MLRRHDSSARRVLRRTFSVLLAISLLLMSLLPAVAAPSANAPAGVLDITTIFTDLAAYSTSTVPGYPGVLFESFDRPFGSPNGNWIMSADTNKPTGTDEVLMVNGVAKIFEGDPAPWIGGIENVGFLDTKVGINDAGEWVFTTDTSGTVNDDFVVKVSATDVYTYVAREGDPIAALPPATWDDIIDSAVIIADGTVGLDGDGIDGGPPTTSDEIRVLGSTLLAQEGVTVPTGQLGTETWENFDFEDFFISADGTQVLSMGDLSGDTNFDDVVTVNNHVVIQEGVILSGTTYAEPVDLSGIVGIWMAPNGDWFARGNNDVTEADWVYSNNGLIVGRGDPIYTGATELFTDAEFSDTFFLHVGDSNGNYVIGGVSDGPTASNGVLVANNTAVVAREGDQLDLDNDGTLDDAYFNTFGNDDGYLSDAGLFYFVATIKDGTGASIGDGFFSVDITSIITPNTPPTLLNVAATSPINENESSTVTGEIVDPDPADTFELELNWGDGTVMTYSYPAGTTVFTETHQYLDDDPSGTPSDVYALTLVLTDSAGGTATAATSVTVDNVAPTVDAGPDQTVIVSTTVSFGGSFADPGTLDSHTIEWDFGDGNTASGTLTPTHVYAARGYYTVTLTVTDDDTGLGSDSLLVTVGQTPTSVGLSGFGESSGGMNLLWLLVIPAGLLLALAHRRRRAHQQP